MSPPVGDAYAAEKKLRRDLKKGKLNPARAGSYVTGRLPVGIYPRRSCDGHVFIVGKAKKSPHWQSGFVQGATCVVCDEDVEPRDASWWMEPATSGYIRVAMGLVKEESQRLREVHGILKTILARAERGTA